MLRGLGIAFIGIACAQYDVTKSKSSANEVEFGLKSKDKDAKTEMRMRLRTTTDDKTLEFEAEARSEADKTKVQARTRFNVRDVYTYADANGNGLLDNSENFTKYDLSSQWGAITCNSTSSPYTCNLCNSGNLPANALCFDFTVTAIDIKLYNRTVRPSTIKIGMKWDPASVPLATGDRIAMIGRFRSSSTFKDRKPVARSSSSGPEEEDEQPSSDGSSVKWEKRVFSPLGASSDVKVGAVFPGAGVADGTEKDNSDGSSMSFRQLQFNFVAGAPFTWDPDIDVLANTGGAFIAVPGLLAFLALLASI